MSVQTAGVGKRGRERGARRSSAAKTAWKPGNLLMPLPVVLASCGGTRGQRANLITLAWVGTICSDPPMLSIAVRPERHSHALIKAAGEFAVNVPSADLAKQTDWCGVVSGRDVDKFAGTGLTPAAGLKVSCPIVLECPVNIECRVRKTLPLGSHTLFLAEIVAVQVSAALVDGAGALDIRRAGLLAFAHGHYFELGRYIGHFGFSVRKRRKRRCACRERRLARRSPSR
ncbi:MAG: flavin reductase family protein [Kiritimatiellae bacterium]|nr:flavin reductase family protein [Kiritimatiellia bacterium]